MTVSYPLVPLRHLSTLPITNGLGLSGSNANPDWPRYIRTTDIASPVSLRDDVFASQPPEIAAKAMVDPGDILMTAAGASIGKSLRYTDSYPACFAGFLVRVRPKSEVAGRFLGYWMQSQHYWDQIAFGAIKSTIENFSASRYRRMLAPVPSSQEQAAIADYLDRETAKIDTLIEEQRRLTELLQEKQQAAIDHLAWSGLQQGTESVPSPIGPALAVPAHWKQTRNKALYRESLDVSTTGAEDLLTVSHLTGVTRRADKKVYMFEAESLVGYRIVLADDLVINTMWAWMGALGVSKLPGVVSPAYGVYRPKDGMELEARYFDYLFRSRPYVVEMTRHSRGIWSSRLRLYPEVFLGLSVVVPPFEEQVEIADHLDEFSVQTNSLLAESQRLMELAKERRSALITAAVTGQIDVREVAV